MKIGIDSYCYHRYFGEDSADQNNPAGRMDTGSFLRRAIELGVDGVSLETCYFESLDESYLKRLKEIIDRGNLEPVVAWGHPRGLEGGRNPAALEDLKVHFRTCRILGAGIMRVVGSSHAYRHEPHGPQIEKLARMFREPVGMAEDQGIRLALENHLDFTADEVFEILEGVSSDSFGMTFDTGNALRIGDDPVSAARKCAQRIFATHIKDVAPLYGGDPRDWCFFASVPVGRGIIDIPKVVRTLKGAGYDGLFAIELDCLHPDYKEEDPSVAESVTYLRKLRDSSA